jgi:hypothetical protein
MTLAIMIVIGILLLFAIGIYQSFKAHIRRHGLLPVLWRWLTGLQHHGVSQSDKRQYRAVYDPGHPGYEVKIRIHKAIQRTCWSVGLPLLALSVLFHRAHVYHPRLDVSVMVISVVLLTEFFWRMRKTKIRLGNNKTVAKPLHKSLAPVVGMPLAAKPGQWINVSQDRSLVRANLPKNYHPNEGERNKVSAIIRDVGGMTEDALITWNLKDSNSYVEMKSATPPPDKVVLQDVIHAIESSTQDNVVLGLGRGNEIVKGSMANDSPHFGLSIAAGGGKSQLARLAAAQILHNGGIVLILDIKRLSHTWARDLPNVRYARTIEEIHAALIWLHKEIDRRTKVADVGVDLEGEVHANVGPRMLVIAEELNEGMARLRRYWTEIRTKNEGKKSPAIEALEEALFMGRQVRINMFAVAQMMTALAAGSGAARENMGIRILGRYTRNAWRMLVPEHDMPQRSMKPGRVQVVTSKIQECQVAFLTGSEARELAISGTITPFPVHADEDMDATGPIPAITEITGEIIDHDANAVSNIETVTLQEALEFCPGKTLAAIRKTRDRAAKGENNGFPDSVGRRGTGPKAPHLYPKDGIKRWYEGA